MSLKTWSCANMGVQWENGTVHEASKRGRRSEMKEKEATTGTGESRDTATSNTLEC